MVPFGAHIQSSCVHAHPGGNVLLYNRPHWCRTIPKVSHAVSDLDVAYTRSFYSPSECRNQWYLFWSHKTPGGSAVFVEGMEGDGSYLGQLKAVFWVCQMPHIQV